MNTNEIKKCTRCVPDSTVKNIRFDKNGVCSLCHLNKKLNKIPDKSKIEHLFKRIQHKMRHREYDCIVPFSGGVDSTYVLYYVKKAGLRPIAVHSDNGWVTDISRLNMEKVVGKLDVPFISLSKDWKIMSDLYLATLKASVPEVCLACEVKSISELSAFSAEKRIPYIFFGYSPRTEGLSPLSRHYIDNRYFKGIVKRFAQNKKATLKLTKLSPAYLIYFTFIRPIKYILLPSLIDWDELKIKKILEKELNWKDEGRHSDCLYYQVAKYIVKKKFNFDRDKTLFSSLINSGKMTREEAIRLLNKAEIADIEDRIHQVTARLGISRREFDNLLSLEPKDFTAYPTYYPFFRMIRPLIWLACRCRLHLNMLYEYFFLT